MNSKFDLFKFIIRNPSQLKEVLDILDLSEENDIYFRPEEFDFSSEDLYIKYLSSSDLRILSFRIDVAGIRLICDIDFSDLDQYSVLLKTIMNPCAKETLVESIEKAIAEIAVDKATAEDDVSYANKKLDKINDALTDSNNILSDVKNYWGIP